MPAQFGVEIPEDITPPVFFKDLLPTMLANAKSAVPLMAEIDFKIQFDIGGAHKFGVSLEKGSAQINEGDLAGAIVKVALDESLWRNSVTGKMPQGLEGAGQGDFMAAAKPRAVEVLKKAKGNLTLTLTHPGAEDTVLNFTFNGAEAPKAKVKMAMKDYVDIQAKKANGPQLFMQGKIFIEGDMGLVMQLSQLQSI